MKILSIVTSLAIATAAEAAIVSDWSTCQPGDTYSGAGYGFSCCVATADAASGKMTCRAGGDCINSGYKGTTVGDWNDCFQGDVCASGNFKCCVAPADVSSGKSTCRPNWDPSQCASSSRSACIPSRYQSSSLASNQRNAAPVSFGGTASFFLHALPSSTQDEILDNIRNAGLKVVRVFISRFYSNEKGSGNYAMNDIEPNTVGSFDNTQLNALNNLMLKAYNRGLKLIIVPHDRYMLGTFKVDAYAVKYLGLNINNQPGGPSYPHQNVRGLYLNSNFGADIDRRLAYIANYPNPNFGNRRIGDIHEAIFGFDMQNEAQAYNDGGYVGYTSPPSNPNWSCQRATALKPRLHPNILTITGGGARLNDSTISAHFTCPALDVISIHSYYTSDFNTQDFNSVTNAALLYKKRLLVEEFGASGSGKQSSLQSQINFFNSYGIPWMFWQTMKPGNPNDHETYTNEAAWSTICSGANTANSISGSSAKFCYIPI